MREVKLVTRDPYTRVEVHEGQDVVATLALNVYAEDSAEWDRRADAVLRACGYRRISDWRDTDLGLTADAIEVPPYSDEEATEAIALLEAREKDDVPSPTLPSIPHPQLGSQFEVLRSTMMSGTYQSPQRSEVSEGVLIHLMEDKSKGWQDRDRYLVRLERFRNGVRDKVSDYLAQNYSEAMKEYQLLAYHCLPTISLVV